MDDHPPFSLAVLRPADLPDLPDLVRLEAACFNSDRLSPRSWRHLIQSPGADVAVALAQDYLVGAGVMLRRKHSSIGRIYSLAVDPAQCGRGLALGLLAHLSLLARRQGLTRLRLEVRPDNTAALQLYLAQGFRPIGVSLAYYQDSGACLHLERLLEGSHAHAPDHRQ